MDSVKPGINAPFSDPTQDIDVFLGKFEIEDREIFKYHNDLCRFAQLPSGVVVADIGAGTGLFMYPLLNAVGPEGRVICLDTAQKFVPHLEAKRAAAASPDQIEILINTDTTLPLPDHSVDVIWMIDTYHHIEFPPIFLAECHRVLKPSGFALIVDFQRIEGVSSEWVMGHVRAPKEVVFQEWSDAGFSHHEILEHPLTENWMAKFQKK